MPTDIINVELAIAKYVIDIHFCVFGLKKKLEV